jgi:hypothetical protein
MPKGLIPIFCLIAIWIGLNQSVALACSCIGARTPNEELQRVDVVFAGRAIGASQKAWRINHIEFDRRLPFLHLTEEWDRNRTVFEVTTVWKGDIFAKTSVIHGLMGNFCGYAFKQGEEYIVYAQWIEGELNTNLCLRNNKLSDAGEDLAAFGAGRPPAPNPSSAPIYIGKLMVVFLLVSVFVWAGRQARRKYGAHES